jgi:hypothetical protein
MLIGVLNGLFPSRARIARCSISAMHEDTGCMRMSSWKAEMNAAKEGNLNNLFGGRPWRKNQQIASPQS